MSYRKEGPIHYEKHGVFGIVKIKCPKDQICIWGCDNDLHMNICPIHNSSWFDAYGCVKCSG